MGVSGAISYHCTHCPCIRKQQPQQKLNYLWNSLSFINTPNELHAPIAIFACHQLLDSCQCQLSQISLRRCGLSRSWPVCNTVPPDIRFSVLFRIILYFTSSHRQTGACTLSQLPGSNPLFLSAIPPLPISYRCRPHWLAYS